MMFAPEPPTVPAEWPVAVYAWTLAAVACLALAIALVADELPPFLDRRARRKRLLTNYPTTENDGTGPAAVGVVEPERTRFRAGAEGCRKCSRSIHHPEPAGKPLARPGKRRASAFYDVHGA